MGREDPKLRRNGHDLSIFKWSIKWFLASIGIIVLACFFTNCLFSTKAPHEFLVARFSADGLLGLIGSVASGVMAVCIAIQSYRQADHFEIQRSEWQSEKDHFEAINTKRPFLVLRAASINDSALEGQCDNKGVWHFEPSGEVKNVTLSLENVGDGPACDVRIIDEVAFGEPLILSQHRIVISPNETIAFEIGSREISEYGSMDLEVNYSNILGCHFAQSLRIDHSARVVSSEVVETEDGQQIESDTDYQILLKISSLSFQEERRK